MASDDASGRGFDGPFSDMFGFIEGAMSGTGKSSLTPLFGLDVKDDVVTATIDLPGVRRENVTITCTEDTISIDAEMTRPVKLRVSGGWTGYQEFVKYSRKILLPVRVDPNKGSAKFKNGMVVVRLPRPRVGKSVKIGAKLTVGKTRR